MKWIVPLIKLVIDVVLLMFIFYYMGSTYVCTVRTYVCV